LDRKALPVPQRDREGLETVYSAPRTATERALAAIWAEVLGVEQVGITDNFFSLGGHSLLVIQMIARVRKVLEVELPMRSLFEAPTIAALAQSLEQQNTKEVQNLVPLQPGVRPQNIPLAPAQQRFWFLDRMDPGSSAYNIPLALRITGSLSVEYCQQALNMLVQRHETLRTTITTLKGKPVQRISPQLEIPCRVSDLSHVSREMQEQTIMNALTEEGERPFKLATGPLIRALVLELSTTEHILLITMHHIITDGWSFDVFLQEFCDLYSALVAGNPAPLSALPALPIQYADFAIWQRQQLEQGMLALQLKYWKEQLAEVPYLSLPLDGPQPDCPTAPLEAQRIELAPALSEAARLLSQREGVTLFMTLLALFQVVLSNWTGQEDIAVGTLVANRSRVEVEALIGCFINTLVLRTNLAGNPAFHDLLKRVQEMTLGAYAHQDTPFESIVNALRSAGQATQKPLYSAMFALHTMPWETAPALSGLEITPVDLRSKTARVDLMLSLSEENGRIHGAFEYNGDLFSRATIARLVRQYIQLLEVIVTDPGYTIQELMNQVDSVATPLLKSEILCGD
ncbi:MAG TPA: condensation domain-containing protein, partial [Ktedonobacteraceae bacterium]|nr:condensation domain-containing protein [Ktedonobacteraceae bacterium]